mmetsp:Transcript_62326/g.179262  ORF Transcript_62326/g.179262 Transcript_62326/m.179262 type:complete len:283 (-) Transcript_62326:158-1006(-)
MIACRSRSRLRGRRHSRPTRPPPASSAANCPERHPSRSTSPCSRPGSCRHTNCDHCALTKLLRLCDLRHAEPHGAWTVVLFHADGRWARRPGRCRGRRVLEHRAPNVPSAQTRSRDDARHLRLEPRRVLTPALELGLKLPIPIVARRGWARRRRRQGCGSIGHKGLPHRREVRDVIVQPPASFSSRFGVHARGVVPGAGCRHFVDSPPHSLRALHLPNVALHPPPRLVPPGIALHRPPLVGAMVAAQGVEQIGTRGQVEVHEGVPHGLPLEGYQVEAPVVVA